MTLDEAERRAYIEGRPEAGALAEAIEASGDREQIAQILSRDDGGWDLLDRLTAHFEALRDEIERMGEAVGKARASTLRDQLLDPIEAATRHRIDAQDVLKQLTDLLQSVNR